MTPDAVVQLLRYCSTQPWGASFHDTLPVGGVDGSLAGRFSDLRVQGSVQAKTGSLGGVKSLSGYATTIAESQWRFRFSQITSIFLPNG